MDQRDDKILLLYIIMSNILPILAIVAAAIGATTFFSKSSSSSLQAPAPAPVPYGGSKRRTNKRNRNKNKTNK